MAKRSVAQLMQRRDRFEEAGKSKKAARVQNRIDKRVMKNPQQGVAVAEEYAQKEFDKNVAANRPNQNAIGGTQTYVTDPETGQVTVNQSLSPEQQQLYNQQIGNVSAANQAFASAFGSGVPFGQAYDFSGAPAAPNVTDLNAARDQYFNTVYDANIEKVNQNFDREREQLETTLYNRGHTPGSPQYDQEMKRLRDEYAGLEKGVRSDAYSQAGLEFERNFNIGTQGRQNFINEQILGRQQPLSELTTLQSMTGGPTMLPNFFNFQPIQYSGPNYGDYLGLGVENNLAQQGLAIDRQQLALAGRGGGGGGAAPAPSFSIGGLPPGGAPQVPSAPNPAATGFATGFTTGVAAA